MPITEPRGAKPALEEQTVPAEHTFVVGLEDETAEVVIKPGTIELHVEGEKLRRSGLAGRTTLPDLERKRRPPEPGNTTDLDTSDSLRISESDGAEARIAPAAGPTRLGAARAGVPARRSAFAVARQSRRGAADDPCHEHVAGEGGTSVLT